MATRTADCSTYRFSKQLITAYKQYVKQFVLKYAHNNEDLLFYRQSKNWVCNNG